MFIIKILTSSFGAAGAALLLQLVMSRSLQVAEFGAYAALASVLAITTPLAVSGVTGLALRRASLDKGHSTDILHCAKFALVLNCLVAYVLTIACTLLGGYSFGLVALLATGYFSSAIQSYLVVVAQLRESAKLVAFSQSVLPVVRLLAVVVIAIYSNELVLLVLALATGNLISFFTYVRVFCATRESSAGSKGVKIRTAARFSLSALAYSINGTVNVAQLQFVVSLSAALFGFVEAGKVSISNTILTAMYIVPNAVFGIYFLPKYHQISALKSSSINPLRHAIASFGVGLASSLFLYAFSDVIIGLLFSSKYLGAQQLLDILVVGVPFRFYSTALGTALLTEALVRRKVLVSIAAIAIQVATTFMLISKGSISVAIGAVVSEVFVSVAFTLLYRVCFHSREGVGK